MWHSTLLALELWKNKRLYQVQFSKFTKIQFSYITWRKRTCNFSGINLHTVLVTIPKLLWNNLLAQRQIHSGLTIYRCISINWLEGILSTEINRSYFICNKKPATIVFFYKKILVFASINGSKIHHSLHMSPEYDKSLKPMMPQLIKLTKNKSVQRTRLLPALASHCIRVWQADRQMSGDS